jgi:hypothetical protein
MTTRKPGTDSMWTHGVKDKLLVKAGLTCQLEFERQSKTAITEHLLWSECTTDMKVYDKYSLPYKRLHSRLTNMKTWSRTRTELHSRVRVTNILGLHS